MSAFAAYLIIIVNSANWISTDVRMTPFSSMDECRSALAEMRTITTASQSGDKSGMIAVAYCSANANTWLSRGSDGTKPEWRWR